MIGLRRRLHEQDEGISLVEILVAIVIIGISLTAFASTLVQSLTNIVRDEQFVRANQLIADQLEGLRTIPYDDLGFYAAEVGASPAPGTVVLSGTRPSGSRAPLPGSQDLPWDGIIYQATYEILWVDDPDVPTPPGDLEGNDYKQVSLTLDWTARGLAYTASSSTDRRPTLEERPFDPPPPCTPGEVVMFEVAPDFVEISPSGETQQDIVVTVETCGPVTEVAVRTVGASGPTTTYGLEDLDRGVRWQLRDLGSGQTQFVPGEYEWIARVEAVDAATAPVRFVRQADNLLDVRDLIATPPFPLCTNPSSGGAGTGRTLVSDTVLEARITGAGPGDTVTFTWTDRAGEAVGQYIGTDAGGNGRFTATIPQGHRFQGTVSTIGVSVDRVSGDSQRVTENFVVAVVRIDTNPEDTCQ